MVPISSTKWKTTRLRIPKAVVAYLAILGFSEKQHEKDRAMSQFDFAGSLRAAGVFHA
jgi:hypothetical protein